MAEYYYLDDDDDEEDDIFAQNLNADKIQNEIVKDRTVLVETDEVTVVTQIHKYSNDVKQNVDEVRSAGEDDVVYNLDDSNITNEATSISKKKTTNNSTRNQINYGNSNITPTIYIESAQLLTNADFNNSKLWKKTFMDRLISQSSEALAGSLAEAVGTSVEAVFRGVASSAADFIWYRFWNWMKYRKDQLLFTVSFQKKGATTPQVIKKITQLHIGTPGEKGRTNITITREVSDEPSLIELSCYDPDNRSANILTENMGSSGYAISSGFGINTFQLNRKMQIKVENVNDKLDVDKRPDVMYFNFENVIAHSFSIQKKAEYTEFDERFYETIQLSGQIKVSPTDNPLLSSTETFDLTEV